MKKIKFILSILIAVSFISNSYARDLWSDEEPVPDASNIGKEDVWLTPQEAVPALPDIPTELEPPGPNNEDGPTLDFTSAPEAEQPFAASVLPEASTEIEPEIEPVESIEPAPVLDYTSNQSSPSSISTDPVIQPAGVSGNDTVTLTEDSNEELSFLSSNEGGNGLLLNLATLGLYDIKKKFDELISTAGELADLGQKSGITERQKGYAEEKIREWSYYAVSAGEGAAFAQTTMQYIAAKQVLEHDYEEHPVGTLSAEEDSAREEYGKGLDKSFQQTINLQTEAAVWSLSMAGLEPIGLGLNLLKSSGKETLVRLSGPVKGVAEGILGGAGNLIKSAGTKLGLGIERVEARANAISEMTSYLEERGVEVVVGPLRPGVGGRVVTRGQDDLMPGTLPNEMVLEFNGKVDTLAHEFKHVKDYLDGRNVGGHLSPQRAIAEIRALWNQLKAAPISENPFGNAIKASTNLLAEGSGVFTAARLGGELAGRLPLLSPEAKGVATLAGNFVGAVGYVYGGIFGVPAAFNAVGQALNSPPPPASTPIPSVEADP